jgi:cell wall-associated NlpC family hydrolase
MLGKKSIKRKPKILIDKKEGTLITRGDSVVNYAKTLLGKPYKYGSCTPDGFDCSGFVSYVYGHFNIPITRSSYTMAEEGIPIPLKEATKGDLIFFKGTNLKDPTVGHVGIVISEKGHPVQFIHASSGANKAVVITDLSSSNYTARFLKVKRLF